jgi:flagellar assembly factor FliW
MKIDIDRFGLKNVQVDPDTLFNFPKGMVGFEDFKRFKLFHEEGGGTVFWLQSVDDVKIAFPVVASDALDVAYEIELSDEDCALLELKDAADVAIFMVVYRNAPEDKEIAVNTRFPVVQTIYRNAPEGKEIAVNTRFPVILNLKTRIGMQKILQDLIYRAH